MSKHSGSGRIGSASRKNRTKRPVSVLARRLGFEDLEHRRLLSTVGLSAISNVTLPAGTSVMVPLNGTDPGQTVKFSVTSQDPTQVTPLVMPQTNKSVQFNINGLGSMTFQLFDNLTPSTASHIETLVNDGFYNGDYIYRAETGAFASFRAATTLPRSTTGTASIRCLPACRPRSTKSSIRI